MSNANFSIKGSLAVTAPTAVRTGLWEHNKILPGQQTGTFPNVELQYSTDGGNTYPNLIIASTPANTGALSLFYDG